MIRDMKLIIESGATKTECCLLDDAGKVCSRFRVAGINVAVTPPEAVSAAVEDVASHMPGNVPGCREIVFYGAGIMEPAVDSVQGKEVAAECLPAGLQHLDMCLHKAFPDAVVEYHSDLLAAARGLCGSHPGIVAILGTGSNSCQYDGVRIVRNIRPGGFILGDEGSASALGRRFLADYVKELLPEAVASDFMGRYGLDYRGVVKLVYGGGSPARDMAALAPYILGWKGDSHIYGMIEANFRDFIERCLIRYDGSGSMDVHVTGSFGTACRDMLESLGLEYGVRFAGFVPGPADGLAVYHASEVRNKRR